MSSYSYNAFNNIFSYLIDRFKEAQLLRFVHYTSADVAMQIIGSRSVWMRNALTMNDYSELEYGRNCLMVALSSSGGIKLKNIIETKFGENGIGLLADIPRMMDKHNAATYISCMSEHDASEDLHGRLSMWRAYGGNSGVAIVVNNRPFVAHNDELGANTYPVHYLPISDFMSLFNKLVYNIENNISYIQNNVGFLNDLWRNLQALQFCIKHPGFREEREWRVVYRPKDKSTDHISGDIVSVRGTPQQIYKLKLDDIPEANFMGASPAEFIDLIIIGPCLYPEIVREAFVLQLTNVGVIAAENKVIVSDIPLRI
ncbi:DUF2971 domain-containing protein [Methylobacterium sp. 17Sr1-1]|uniref:DUF2971 domain-containing protein n=1 Tax=Methylobacterium sp. 17Sr1-1 TaxID=2202826 RepID=UPI0019514D98|nr:DUF2971 domain-containing protein [Methylobacterium sp. 17Sr1-1]